MRFDESAIKAYAHDRIAQVSIVEAPLPHFIVENVLPADFYRAVIDLIPARDAFKPYYPAEVKPRDANETFVLRREATLKLAGSDAEAATWTIFWNCLNDVGHQIGAKMKPYLPAAIRMLFPDSWIDRLGKIDLSSIVADMTDGASHYKILPHLYSPFDAATWLFNMPGDDRHRGSGTVLYEATIPDGQAFDPMEA